MAGEIEKKYINPVESVAQKILSGSLSPSEASNPLSIPYIRDGISLFKENMDLQDADRTSPFNILNEVISGFEKGLKKSGKYEIAEAPLAVAAAIWQKNDLTDKFSGIQLRYIMDAMIEITIKGCYGYSISAERKAEYLKDPDLKGLMISYSSDWEQKLNVWKGYQNELRELVTSSSGVER